MKHRRGSAFGTRFCANLRIEKRSIGDDGRIIVSCGHRLVDVPPGGALVEEKLAVLKAKR
jgi:hypothetical protein